VSGFERIVSEPLGGSALARAISQGATAPLQWCAPRPSGVAGWRAAAAAARGDASTARARLDSLAPALGAAGQWTSLRDAFDRGSVVTTGQQPGLLGGPLYTLWKALSARSLAAAIQRATGMPVVPVFWAATDDADFAEASGTTVIDSGELHVLHLSVPDGHVEGTPLAHVPAHPTSDLRALLRRAAGSAASADIVADALEAWTSGRTIGDAYVAQLRGLLEPLGIAVIDAAHPAVGAASRQTLGEALTKSAAVIAALDAREAAITAAGFEPQVQSVPGLSLVFGWQDGSKVRLKIGARVDDSTRLSPNVLLRPVVERAILPTVAYVAGPGELAYFAQVSAVADALEVASPVAVPRWSGTVVDHGSARLLDEMGLEIDDLIDLHRLENTLATEALAPAVRDALASAHVALRSASRALIEEGAGVPRASVDGAVRSIELRLERLARRYRAAVKRGGDERLRRLQAASAMLRPGGKRQERVIGFVALLARYGPTMLTAASALTDAHAVTIVDDIAAPGSETAVRDSAG